MSRSMQWTDACCSEKQNNNNNNNHNNNNNKNAQNGVLEGEEEDLSVSRYSIVATTVFVFVVVVVLDRARACACVCVYVCARGRVCVCVCTRARACACVKASETGKGSEVYDVVDRLCQDRRKREVTCGRWIRHFVCVCTSNNHSYDSSQVSS